MPPRKSLPAPVTTYTPIPTARNKRTAPNTSPSSVARPNKRLRRTKVEDQNEEVPENAHVEGNGAVEEDDDTKASDQPAGDATAIGDTAGLEDEAELDAWQEFVADHYEMVEQLPLELHRNFRLLRELDDDCAAQTDKLHGLIREYAYSRMGAPKKPVIVVEKEAEAPEARKTEDEEEEEEAVEIVETGSAAPVPSRRSRERQSGQEVVNETEEPEEAVEEVEDKGIAARVEDDTVDQPQQVETTQPLTTSIAPPAPPYVDENIHCPEDMGMPLSDGQGGLLLPAKPDASIQTASTADPLPGFPVELVNSGDQVEHPSESNGPSAEKVSSRPDLLPEIGKLMREIVRNCEEKVAVAGGAYNAIDRHIRALDSALSAQEASILLGLRPDTNPSIAVDTSLNLAGDPNVPIDGDDGELAIGVGGGGRRGRKKQKGKKGAVPPAVPVIEVGKAGFPYIDLTGVEIDPNDLIYCFCQQVSCGEMVGCENAQCPYEWFHLPCVGMTTPPAGAWWCPECKPRPGGGMGGAGTIRPKTGPARKKGGRR